MNDFFNGTTEQLSISIQTLNISFLWQSSLLLLFSGFLWQWIYIFIYIFFVIYLIIILFFCDSGLHYYYFVQVLT